MHTKPVWVSQILLGIVWLGLDWSNLVRCGVDEFGLLGLVEFGLL